MLSDAETPRKMEKEELKQKLSHHMDPQSATELASLISETRHALTTKYNELEDKLSDLMHAPTNPAVQRDLKEYCMQVGGKAEDESQDHPPTETVQINEEISSLKEEKEQLSNRLNTKNEEYAELEERYSDINAKSKAQTRKIESLRNKISTLQSNISQLREQTSELSELKELKEHYEHQIERKNERIQSLEEQLEEKTQEMEAVKSMTSTLREEIKTLKEKAQTKENEETKEDLTDFATQLEERFSSLKEGISADVLESVTDSKGTGLQRRIDTLKSHIDQFEMENEKLQSQLEETKEKLKKLQNRNHELKQETQKLRSRVEELKSVPKELEQVLELSPVGKAYYLLRDIGQTTFDQLGSAMGVSGIKVRRYVMKLVQADLAEIQGRKIVYQGKIR